MSSNTATSSANANAAIDFRTLPTNVPSLCIPRVYPNITEVRIRKTFNDLDLGDIERIDIVSKTSEKGDKFNRVFIHFKRWYVNENADAARGRLLNGKDIKIIYDDPWFWKISAYREPIQKPKPQQVQPPFIKKKVTLIIESDDEDEAPKQPAKVCIDPRRPDDRRDDRRRPDDRGYDKGYDRGDEGKAKQEKPRQNEGFKKTKKEDTERVSVQPKRELVKYGYGIAPSLEMEGGISMEITRQRQPKPKPLASEVKTEEANK
jgi:hypothetical protein